MGFWEERTGLAGRVGIIVGGGGGLGRASAEDLGGAGMRLALCDKDKAGLEETAAAVRDAGGEVITAELDARDPEALAAFFGQVDEAYGDQLHVLVNMVGGTFRANFTDTRPKGWEALVRTNFTWMLSSIQLAIPRMRAAGGGSIINFSSIEGHRAAPRYAVYAAMKAAVNSLSRTLALELGPDGIRVNTVAPDFTPTPNLAALTAGPEEPRQLRDAIGTPMGRCGTYRDVGGCVLFLASDLSSFVTGTALHPDGGAIASSGWFNWPEEGYLNFPPPGVVDWLLADR